MLIGFTELQEKTPHNTTISMASIDDTVSSSFVFACFLYKNRFSRQLENIAQLESSMLESEPYLSSRFVGMCGVFEFLHGVTRL